MAVCGVQMNGSPRKRPRTETNKVTVILGAQWGDEGKGKVVDMLATEVDVVCRCQVTSCMSFELCVNHMILE